MSRTPPSTSHAPRRSKKALRSQRRRVSMPRLPFIAAAALAGFATTAIGADTLAQPRDNSLEQAAASYVRFREDIAAIEQHPFSDAEVTREAHRRLASHDSAALTRGWVAYAALVAADTPEFAESLRKAAKKRGRRGQSGKDAFLTQLAQNPRYPRELKGSSEAIDAVLAMITSDGARISSLGESYKEQAYAMQKTKWGKQRISAGAARLQEAEGFRQSRPAPVTPASLGAGGDGVVAPALASVSGSWAADWGADATAGTASERNADVIIDRILNLAARYSVGSINPKLVEVYAKNDRSARCLSMAKLTLDQCIAATRSPYEEAFCLGEHGMIDIATCTGWVAGGAS